MSAFLQTYKFDVKAHIFTKKTKKPFGGNAEES